MLGLGQGKPFNPPGQDAPGRQLLIPQERDCAEKALVHLGQAIDALQARIQVVSRLAEPQPAPTTKPVEPPPSCELADWLGQVTYKVHRYAGQVEWMIEHLEI